MESKMNPLFLAGTNLTYLYLPLHTPVKGLSTQALAVRYSRSMRAYSTPAGVVKEAELVAPTLEAALLAMQELFDLRGALRQSIPVSLYVESLLARLELAELYGPSIMDPYRNQRDEQWRAIVSQVRQTTGCRSKTPITCRAQSKKAAISPLVTRLSAPILGTKVLQLIRVEGLPHPLEPDTWDVRCDFTGSPLVGLTENLEWLADIEAGLAEQGIIVKPWRHLMGV